jgi:hypothetical protein
MNEPAEPQSPDTHGHVGHETTDASAFYVGLFALGLAIMIALVLPFLVWLFWRFEASAERADPVQSAVAADQLPPAPRLQAQPSVDLAKLRHDEDERLGSYKWIDQQQGIVQLPIDRAIDLLAEQGLPEPQVVEPTSTKQEPVP